MALRLLENTFASKKTESVRFYSLKTLSQIPMMTPQVEENYLFPPNIGFENLFLPLAEKGEGGERLWSWKNDKIWTFESVDHKFW